MVIFGVGEVMGAYIIGNILSRTDNRIGVMVSTLLILASAGVT